MIKKYVVIFVLFSLAAASSTVTAEDQGGKYSVCDHLSYYGELTMGARQKGAPISQMMRMVAESDKPREMKLMYEIITNKAYDYNVVAGQETKKEATKMFKNEIYTWCVGLVDSAKKNSN